MFSWNCICVSLCVMCHMTLQCFGQTALKTQIVIGNKIMSKIEVYNVTFRMSPASEVVADPIQLTDLVWSSPVTPEMTEVKPVIYKGQRAVLSTTENGVIIYAYPSGSVLFHKEFMYPMNIHSAAVLPDGNVIAALSLTTGWFGILYPGGNVTQPASSTSWISETPYAHAVYYSPITKLLYAGGYLTFLAYNYTSGKDGRGQLNFVKKVNLYNYYDQHSQNETAATEDGLHDIYPIDGDCNNLYFSTGEHVFTINLQTYAITNSSIFYTIPSWNSILYNVSIPNKGDVKSISKDNNIGVVMVKPAPWFLELYNSTTGVDSNYDMFSPIVAFSFPNIGQCLRPDYDLTPSCKLVFNFPAYFYKARVFKFPPTTGC